MGAVNIFPQCQAKGRVLWGLLGEVMQKMNWYDQHH